ncbi:MAG: AraC family transcriptional regulator [Defluviitaleaceae bacterium]|nr:AraC family transcriptional regulator [Defluviitaleaceae bacterium]
MKHKRGQNKALHDMNRFTKPCTILLKGGGGINWVETLNRAIDYTENHLLDEISLAQIAMQVHMSTAHLQRGFSALAGLTIGEYIRNRRLSLAGLELTHKDVRVIDVAIKYGYETSESFSKAFKRFHGIAPSAAKQYSPDLKLYSRLTIKIIMEGGSIMDYRIEEKQAFEVVVKAKNVEVEEGNSTQIPAFWCEYFATGLAKTVVPVLGVCGDMSEDSKNFRYGIGDFMRERQEVPDGFEIWQVPKCTWAVFKCVGAMPLAIQEMWKRIYSEWLPQAKYEILPSYDFELYTDGDKGSPDYISEIWLPVKNI